MEVTSGLWQHLPELLGQNSNFSGENLKVPRPLQLFFTSIFSGEIPLNTQLSIFLVNSSDILYARQRSLCCDYSRLVSVGTPQW